jgi:DNA processing protein
MGTAIALESHGGISGSISPYREVGAYEALWTETKASFRWIADKFRARPGSLPSDFVPEEESLARAAEVRSLLQQAGVEHYGIRVHGAGEYPESLRVADHPIELLYFQGWWDLVNSNCVALVGTRQPSAEGEARARRLTKNLIADDWTVVSGLARGIDTIVHTTALAEGGRTIAVLGTPLTVRYPRENSGLQERLAAEQLIISQVPVIRYKATVNPTANRFFFIERNITMSALTAATIIIEAGETSGTLVQARHALKQRKKVFILDSNFRNSALTWPARLEEQGAIRVREYEEIKEQLGKPSLND